MIRSFDERLLAMRVTACLGSQELLENAEEHKKGPAHEIMRIHFIGPGAPGKKGCLSMLLLLTVPSYRPFIEIRLGEQS